MEQPRPVAAGDLAEVVDGPGQATGLFAWEPACDAGSTTVTALTVRFRLTETGPCVPVPRERVVRFEVVPAKDSVAFRPPNVITPNGDARNDFLIMPDLPVDFCGRSFAGIKIYSRWGQLVYQSPDRTFHWGGAGTAGNYYYLVSYTDGRRFKGWVEVIP